MSESLLCRCGRESNLLDYLLLQKKQYLLVLSLTASLSLFTWQHLFVCWDSDLGLRCGLWSLVLGGERTLTCDQIHYYQNMDYFF